MWEHGMSGTNESAVKGLRRALRFVLKGRYWALSKVAGTAFLGGMAEALFLVTITRAAFAITGSKPRVGIVSSWYLSVDQTLILAAGMLLIRVTLAASTSWRGAELASNAIATVRHRLARAFLGASWEVQQEQRAGSLQELSTSYTGHASALMGSVSMA